MILATRALRHITRISLCDACCTLLAILLVPIAAQAAKKESSPPVDTFRELADEVSDKIIASPAFRAKAEGGRKARIVIGDVRNNSDDEQIRVEDIFNDIRNRIVAGGQARLFATGELNVDLIIAPELTSRIRGTGGTRQHCFTLQLTLTTVDGEYIAALGAERCG